jgi:Do/DeqQ family serine protease
MKLKQVLSVMLISGLTTVAVIYGYNKLTTRPITIQSANAQVPSNYVGLFDSNNNIPGQAVDFQAAASSTTPAVVHITTVIGQNQASNNLPKRSNPFADLFGDDFFKDFDNQMRSVPQRASGSGVIVSDDGYIITNNHVIDEADEIKVTLSNKKSYTAKLIGTDPSSDLALLKVDAKGLPFLLYGNSDQVKIGQWVLAVGYPLNLETTVTAGIVSAKARTLGLNSRKSNTPIESFIQTDAAVNQGNSGGALVNTNGELVGIVSAIASPTGAYAGYSYAIPVNIVKKIINDIIQFGTVQRAYLGISYLPENAPDSERDKLSFKEGQGVLVLDVAKDGAMASSGITKGDYISKVNGVKVTNGSEMVEQVAGYKPGDKISVTYNRGSKEYNTQVTLKNRTGSYDVVRTSALDNFGAEFETLDKKKAAEFGIRGGVVVKRISKGLIDEQTRMRDGFIIYKVNDQEVKSIEEFSAAMNKGQKRVMLEGIYPGYDGTYKYPIEIEE